MIQFDHMAVDVRDLEASARFMSELLDLGEPVPEGVDDDMLRLNLDHGGFILLSLASSPRFSHVAFRVDSTRFQEIVGRLRASGTPFGNDHSDTTNGKTDDPFGGGGRVYFHDDNGHLWEVAC